jgi:shikimate kinase
MNTAAPGTGCVRPIALIGLRAVGKTTLGRGLARVLGLGFVDLDEAVAWSASEGCCASHVASVAEIAAHSGWEAFRDMEQRELERVLVQGGALVLATGGGVVERAANREVLRQRALCIWLRAELELLRGRLRGDASRPSLTGASIVEELESIALRRSPWYAEVAHATLDVGSQSPVELIERLRALCDVR